LAEACVQQHVPADQFESIKMGDSRPISA